MDRVRFFEYALGSAREATHWYGLAVVALSPEAYAERLDVLEQIRRILLAAIPLERERQIRPRARSK